MLTKAKLRKFNISDWLSLEEAFARIREVWGSFTLACVVLEYELRDDQLKSVVALMLYGRPPEYLPLEQQFWQGIEIELKAGTTDSIQLVDLIDGSMVEFRSANGELAIGFQVFIQRAEFDMLCSSAKQSAQAEAGAPKGRPGRPTKYDWHTICGEIAARCIDPKTQRLKIPKNQSKLAAEVLLSYKNGGPSMTEMQEAVRLVLAVLRRL
jgi:hypothetical protein